jgi:anhydro-N-acetylmuramic acid kinase
MEYLREAQKTSDTENISVPDIIATLTRFSADTISEAIHRTVGSKPQHIFISGGGAHNPLMARWISERLPNSKFSTTADLGISGDAKEAVLFAVLANETLTGGSTGFGKRRKVPSVSMGKVSFPK